MATTKKLVAKPATKATTAPKTKAAPKEKATKKVAAPKATKAVEPVVEVVEVEDATDAQVKRTCEELNEETIVMVKGAMDSLRGVVKLVREATKAHNHELKDALRKKKTKSENKGERAPAGFTKPCLIKDTLADFLRDAAGNDDVERGCQLSRTDVTKRLNKYFVDKDLRDEKDKRRILFHNDAALGKIISFDKDTPLTYFNLQSAIKDQFVTV